MLYGHAFGKATISHSEPRAAVASGNGACRNVQPAMTSLRPPPLEESDMEESSMDNDVVPGTSGDHC